MSEKISLDSSEYQWFQITVSIPGPEGDNESISAGGVPIFSTVIRSG